MQKMQSKSVGQAAPGRRSRTKKPGAALPPDFYTIPEDGSIPKFLLVANRHLLPKKAALTGDPIASAVPERKDWSKPKSLSWEEWDAHLAQRAIEKCARATARIEALKEKQIERAKKSVGAKTLRPTGEWRLVIKEKTCPYKAGTSGAKVYALYKDGITVATLEKKAAGLTGKRRPLDMLMYDVRKGRIVLAPPAEGGE